MKIDKKKLHSVVWAHIKATGSRIDHFRGLGYTMKIQPRRRCPHTKRVRLDPPPTDPSRKITWVMLEQNPFTRSRYWLGVPKDIAEKALVLGFLPSLEETKPVRITH